MQSALISHRAARIALKRTHHDEVDDNVGALELAELAADGLRAALLVR